MASYIYLVTNIVNNKYYLGKTNNKKLRWSQHKSKSKTKNSYFYNALRKYGPNNFIFEIIKECRNEEDAYEYERVLIELFQLRNRKYGYNIIEGGSGGSKGYKVKEELKQYFKEKYTGSKSIRAKFSDEIVLEILNKYSTGKFIADNLAKEYGCGKSTIIRILSGESYSNINFDRSQFKKFGENNRDKNIPKGTESSTSKLSLNDIEKIIQLRQNGLSYQKLANIFQVSGTTIYNLINGKTYGRLSNL